MISRVVIDTNLWISFLISHSFAPLGKLLKEGKVQLIFSEELLAELLQVIQRPKFERFFSPSDVQELLDHLQKFSKIEKVTSEVTLCRDAKDNFLLNLSIDASVDYLITGDKDLLVLERIQKQRS